MKPLSRREFVKLSSLLGVSLGLPLGLSGCDDEPAKTPTSTAELKTVHVDLSHLAPELLAAETFSLHLPGRRFELLPHDADTRRAHRAASPWLQKIADQYLTHYVADVPHSSTGPTRRWVSGTTKFTGRGSHCLVHVSIHHPRAALDKALAAPPLGATSLTSAAPQPVPADLEAAINDLYTYCKSSCNTVYDDQTASVLLDNDDQFISCLDTAKAIVFHHPEVMSLHADTAALITARHISACTFLPDFAFLLCCQGAAYEHDATGNYADGWCVLVPQQNEAGLYLKKAADGSVFWEAEKSGELVYDYSFSKVTTWKMKDSVNDVIKRLKNDPDLEGKSWSYHQGTTAVTQGESPVIPGADVAACSSWDEDGACLTPAAGPVGAGGGGAYGLTPSRGSGNWKDGVLTASFQSSTDPRSASLWVMNFFNRTVGVYCQFEDADGTPVPPGAGFGSKVIEGILGETILETDTLKFAGLLISPPILMGLPVLPPIPTVIRIDGWPDAATQCRVFFSSLGLFNPHHMPQELIGIAMTAVVDYALPMVILNMTEGGDALYETVTLKSILWGNKALIFYIVKFVVDALKDLLSGDWGKLATDLSADFESILVAIANALPRFLLDLAMAEIAAWLLEKETESESMDNIPYAGWAVRLLGTAVVVETIAITTVECLTCHGTFENLIVSTMDLQVTVLHDVADTHFPAVATEYVVVATYATHDIRQSPPQKLPDTLVSDPIVYTFVGVPAGGKVVIEVFFRSADGWLAGYGSPSMDAAFNPIAIDNMVNNVEAGRLDVTITLHEFLVPLTASTQYSHKAKLGYDATAGAHLWEPALNTPSTATQANLSCDNTTNALCQATGLSMALDSGQVAYSWRAAGGDIKACSTGEGGSQLHQMQTVLLAQRPDDNWAQAGCGLVGPSRIVLTRGQGHGPSDGYWLDPRGQGMGCLVRGLTVYPQASLDTADTTSFGLFTLAPDDVCWHPAGYLVGVATAFHKLVVLKLPEVALTTATPTFPSAAIKSGEGTRVGLLSMPVALAVRTDGTLLVLEQGTARIQAFDLSGASVNCFGTASTAALEAETGPVTYLDLSVESQGFMYVLSYAGAGDQTADYRLDLYSPTGAFLVRTTGVAAARLVVDRWRTAYTLNYESLVGAGGRTEPSVSEWLPSTP